MFYETPPSSCLSPTALWCTVFLLIFKEPNKLSPLPLFKYTFPQQTPLVQLLFLKLPFPMPRIKPTTDHPSFTGLARVLFILQSPDPTLFPIEPLKWNYFHSYYPFPFSIFAVHLEWAQLGTCGFCRKIGYSSQILNFLRSRLSLGLSSYLHSVSTV